MEITNIKVGELRTNCYIISENNKCLIIDPGDEFIKIKEVIGNNEVVGVIVTHHHFDHIGALKYFDKKLWLDKNNLEEKEYNIDSFNFRVIYTPGHKEDCISIYFEKEKIMFTGDFLFKGTIGRTDLLCSNHDDMMKSLNKISKYEKDIKVYPGHGHSTILGDEV